MMSDYYDSEYDYDYYYYPYQDEIKGHYSRHFGDIKSPPLPSQYLELEVDSVLDCYGEG